MSAPFYHNDLEDENLQRNPSDRLISTVSNKLNDLNSESQLSAERILKMQETIASLKSELQSVVVKVEQNVGIFKGKITNKIALVLNLLKKKQIHIQATLDNCYNIIDNLIETFLNVGHELEKDVTVISLKVNDFDNEIKNMIAGRNTNIEDTLWFINNEGRLTKRKSVVLSSTLPRFKCGGKKVRKSFIVCLADVFNAYQVPKDQWVKLASTQLIGMARDWWNMHDKEMTWSQFAKSFIEWSFNDDCVRRNHLMPKQDENDFEKNGHTDPIRNLFCSKLQPTQSDLYSNEFQNLFRQNINDNNINSGTHKTASSHSTNIKKDPIKTKSQYTLHNFGSEESAECEESSTSEERQTSSDEVQTKRKYSLYTASNNNSILKKRKIFKTNDEAIKKNTTFINGRYKLRKRK